MRYHYAVLLLTHKTGLHFGELTAGRRTCCNFNSFVFAPPQKPAHKTRQPASQPASKRERESECTKLNQSSATPEASELQSARRPAPSTTSQRNWVIACGEMVARQTDLYIMFSMKWDENERLRLRAVYCIAHTHTHRIMCYLYDTCAPHHVMHMEC